MPQRGRVWILGQWFSGQTVRRIADAVEAEPEVSRRALGRRVCEWLGWRSADGRLRETSGRKALAELEKRGLLQLPKPARGGPFRKKTKRPAQQSPKEVAEPEVRCSLGDLGDVEVVPISSRYSKDSKTWKALLARHHYLGAGPSCGAQLRYLVRSRRCGVLGGLSFSSASKRLRCRDEWIGWSEHARRANLARVVCNSRFLIRAGVEVPHLASHVLSVTLRRLPQDWQERYGCKPVLVETFVDPLRFKGTCYRAANWEPVGETAGRADGYVNGKVSTGSKQVYTYPLCKGWKALLCKEPHEPLVNRGRAADAKDWADEEFGGVQIFEGRLRRRLSTLARDFFKQPGKPIPAACEGSEAKTRAASRFFRNKRIDMQTLLKGHAEATLERVQNHRVVLAVQDTTTVNYTAHASTEGLGPIATRQDSAVGLVLHSTIGFTSEGTPLGILAAQCWARDPKEAGKRERRKELNIEEKESAKWLQSYRTVAEAQRLCPNTTFVSTGDREADIHELFEEAEKTEGGPKLLVRANGSRERRVATRADRSEEGYEYLWDRLSSGRSRGTLKIAIPRQGSRPARDAKLEVRFAKVSLQPPKKRPDLHAVEVWAVHVQEVGYPPSVKEPVDWMLLTTVPVTSFEEAIERVRWYALRWGIEVFHRILKSGCRVEDRQLDDAESIKNCLAIDMVVAWRIHWMTKLGREAPDVPSDSILSEDEWQVLHAAVCHEPPPANPPPLRVAIRQIAKLGGFLGRKCDREPGTVTLWRGLDHLTFLAAGWRLAIERRARDGP